MNRNATKWMIGLSSVVLFTGLLYIEETVLGEEKPDQEATAGNPAGGTGSSLNPGSSSGGSSPGSSADTLQPRNPLPQEQRQRGQEITITPRSDSSADQRSQLRTRRS